MARPRKSDAEKKLLGTAQPCRMVAKKKQAKSPATKNDILFAKGLPKKAKDLICVVLEYLPDGFITPENTSLLERWARTYLLYCKTMKLVEKQGVTIEYYDSNENLCVKENPAFTAVTKLSSILATCERQLGFTPSTRANVTAHLSDDEEDVNPFEDFLG